MNIVLAAFGKRGYFYAAYNLAFSIKHYDPTANILLIHDAGLSQLPDQRCFDKFHAIDEATTHPKGTLDAGNVKLNVYKIATKYFSKYMFLDVDAVALKSLKEWYYAIDQDFATDVRGRGKIDDDINYSVWATNENIWKEFKLKKSDEYLAVQSSWHYAKKTKENGAMFRDALRLNKNTFADRKEMLKIRWGANLPDELILGGAIVRAGIDPAVPFRPIFFGDRHAPLREVKEHYIMSMFGNGKGKTLTKRDFIEFYNKHLLSIFRQHNMNFHYKAAFIMRDKYIN
jgi:hypothetical protein